MSTPDKKPSKHQLNLLQHHKGIKHELSWPGPRTPTIVLDQVLLPLSPTEDPLILKVSSPRHRNHYYSASPSYRQQTASQNHQSPHRTSTPTRTSDTDTIQHNRLIEISNQEAPRRTRSIASPATPPKPRIWDEDNAFHAFQVEHSKLGVDLTISCDESAAEATNKKPTKINGLKKHKISMGHVEIVMSELDKAKFKTQQIRNRFQVRYSSDGHRNLEVEEIQQSGSSSSLRDSNLSHHHQENQSSLSPSPRVSSPVHDPNHQEHALPDSGSVSSRDDYRTRSRSPINRHHSHESITSSSRREQGSSPSNHEAQQVQGESTYEATEQQDSSLYLPTENRISCSPPSRRASSAAAIEDGEETREESIKQDDFSPYLPVENRLETPFPPDDHPSYFQDESLQSPFLPTSSRPNPPHLPLTSRISPGGFLRESEERESGGSPIDQDASRTSPDVSCSNYDASRTNQVVCRMSQGAHKVSSNNMREGYEPALVRNRTSSQIQIHGVTAEVADTDSDRDDRSDEEIASRLCSVESDHSPLHDRHGDYGGEEEEEEEYRDGSTAEEDSVRPPSPAHRSSQVMDENNQHNPISISSSVSPSVDLPSCSPQSQHRRSSPRSANVTDFDRSGCQPGPSENENEDYTLRGPEVLPIDLHPSKRHSSGGPDRQSEQRQDEQCDRSSSPKINHSSHSHESSTSVSSAREWQRPPETRSESLALEGQDADYSVSLDDLTLSKAQGNFKKITSTPRGVFHHPVPFPAVSNPTVSRTPAYTPSPSTCPIVEIVSSDPKVAARAAAILKVHHGFIPRGCKVENTGLIGDDDLEREMELSVQREEADRSLRLHASSTTTSSDHHNLLRAVQTKSMPHHSRTDSPASSTHNLSTETERQRTPEFNHHSRSGARSPCSVATTTRQTSTKRKTHHSHCQSLKEELQQLNYRPNMLSWGQADWKILEFCFKRTERKQPFEGSVESEEVVLKMLEALDLAPSDCQSEWEWTKMIHRVIALQKRRSLDPSRRSRCSSATTPTSHRQMVERSSSRHQSGTSGSSSQAPHGGPAAPSYVEQDQEVPREDGRGMYPSLEPVRRAFSRGRSTTPLPPHSKDRPGENVDPAAQSMSPASLKPAAPPKHQALIPKAPPISDRFRRQCLRNTIAYWNARGPRRVGKGKIWTVVAAFEARFDTLSASLLPPPNMPMPPDTDVSSSSRPNKRSLDNSVKPYSSSTTASSNTTTMFHPSFVNDFYSEHAHLVTTAPNLRSWKKQRKN